jgi:V/A-type H+/Na+-transporting ATPase subunit E
VITVEDKLQVFSKSIIEKVEKDCDNKLFEHLAINKELLDNERKKVSNEALLIIENMKKKAESEKSQMISKAIIEKEHSVLIKKRDIFEMVVNDIRKMTVEFTHKPQYKAFLEMCMNNGLSQVNSDKSVIFFTPHDIEKYREDIKAYINENYNTHKRIDVDSTNADILGGCIVENLEKTIRIDCSVESLIDDSKERIGKILMDNL